MRRQVLLYGIVGGLLVAGLKAVEYRWLAVEHSVAIYGGIVAAVFAALGIWSESTVKTHSTRVFEKLGARRRTQAVQRAKQRGLIP